MDYLKLLESGLEKWNQWRNDHPDEPCSLAGANLREGYFFKGNFRGVDLSGANLQQACFIEADLREANLSGADLRGAYMGDANLQGANLSQALLQGTHLNQADLRHANLAGTALAEAHTYKARLPGLETAAREAASGEDLGENQPSAADTAQLRASESSALSDLAEGPSSAPSQPIAPGAQRSPTLPNLPSSYTQAGGRVSLDPEPPLARRDFHGRLRDRTFHRPAASGMGNPEVTSPEDAESENSSQQGALWQMLAKQLRRPAVLAAGIGALIAIAAGWSLLLSHTDPAPPHRAPAAEEPTSFEVRVTHPS